MENIKAGRELDALIGEKVMGWTKHPGPGRSTNQLWYPPGRPALQLNSMAQSLGPEELPRFSTDIVAAKTVQKILEKTWSVTISKHCGEAQYFCELTASEEQVGTVPDVCEEAETEALAICAAALKAKA